MAWIIRRLGGTIPTVYTVTDGETVVGKITDSGVVNSQRFKAETGRFVYRGPSLPECVAFVRGVEAVQAELRGKTK